jgi:hypothetical protein
MRVKIHPDHAGLSVLGVTEYEFKDIEDSPQAQEYLQAGIFITEEYEQAEKNLETAVLADAEAEHEQNDSGIDGNQK